MPNVDVKLPAITEKDKEDILFGISQGIDYIAFLLCVPGKQCARSRNF